MVLSQVQVFVKHTLVCGIDPSENVNDVRMPWLRTVTNERLCSSITYPFGAIISSGIMETTLLCFLPKEPTGATSREGEANTLQFETPLVKLAGTAAEWCQTVIWPAQRESGRLNGLVGHLRVAVVWSVSGWNIYQWLVSPPGHCVDSRTLPHPAASGANALARWLPSCLRIVRGTASVTGQNENTVCHFTGRKKEGVLLCWKGRSHLTSWFISINFLWWSSWKTLFRIKYLWWVEEWNPWVLIQSWPLALVLLGLNVVCFPNLRQWSAQPRYELFETCVHMECIETVTDGFLIWIVKIMAALHLLLRHVKISEDVRKCSICCHA